MAKSSTQVARRRAVLIVASVAALSVTLPAAAGHAAASAPSQPVSAGAGALWAYGSGGHVALNCATYYALCTEVHGWQGSFPSYVGHDEPSMLFYSNTPGSGYQMSYGLTLPSDPGNPAVYSAASTTNTYNLELHPAFWFGMAMCDTQSYPQQDLNNCTPDSDSNITTNDFAGLSSHKGTAFMEMQFYPPGDNHQPDAVNPCAVGQGPGDNQWCAALNIDSLSEDPINGTELNSTCTSVVGSIEYVNFAIVTTTGASPGPANPVDSTPATYDGSPAQPTFFMNSGDKLQVTFNDIPDSSPGPNGSGLQVIVKDLTTNTQGSMVASGTGATNNGFAMVQYAPGTGPNTSTNCNPIPYNFHPMYDTSSPGGRVIWAAHTYNISFSDEIGHWDFCSGQPSSTTFACNGQNLPGITEGAPGDTEPTDADDTGCFPPSAVGTLPVTRCIGTNGGFDGVSYHNDWPTSETPSATVPTPVTFTSPLTGGSVAANDTVDYTDAAFETDLPRIEGNDLPATKNDCKRLQTDNNGNPVAGAGNNCYLIPLTDDSTASSGAGAVHADFYPWFNSYTTAAGCVWQEGGIPSNGSTVNDFGKNNEYGPLLPVTYLSGNGTTASTGTTKTIVNLEDFHNDLQGQPCPAGVSVVTPEVPIAPLILLVGGGVMAVGLGVRRRVKRVPPSPG